MKALIILTIIATVAIIFFQYSRNKNLKKLLIALATFGAIISLAVVGNLTRQVIPLFMTHIILIVVSWGGLIIYLVRDKYYWWAIFSPVVTIGLFLLLELLTGSGHEGISQIVGSVKTDPTYFKQDQYLFSSDFQRGHLKMFQVNSVVCTQGS